jgi:NAD(P)-dependent dehydrogenase (short-subunit alcohol dehydrogenase family)
MSTLFDLTGKVAIVTGGNRGLGKAIALGLARAGADVVVTSRTLSTCTAVAEAISRTGRAAIPVACELGRWDDIDRLVSQTYARFGRCDVVVNNAGMAQPMLPLFDTSNEFMDEVHAVNVKGPIHLARLAARRMGEAGGGSIINILTVGALRGVGNMGVYCASKAALHVLTRVMAEEWAPLGVRVNAIAPGTFLTDMMYELEAATPGFIQHAAEQAIQKRAGNPEEIVGAVVFLASNASSYVTAQTLSVCGGYT